jgi:conjugative transfer pilus assembly protein TraH
MRCLFFLLATLFSQMATADINNDLNRYFNNMLSSNAESGNAYLGQSAGFYTPGNLLSNNTGRDIPIIQTDLPPTRSGCNGIDAFSGGFSFINSNDLINVMKNILNNAKAYAFNLALESATPEIANTLKYVQNLENNVTQANINSCETAAGLVGSFWPKTQAAQQQICADIGTGQGLFNDWASAKQACGSGGQLSQTLSAAKGPYKNIASIQGNIAWQAILKNKFLQNDLGLAELFLSLSGSIIVHKTKNTDDAPNEVTQLPSLANNGDLLKALLRGGTVEIYHCDTQGSNGCLNPVKIQVTIAPSSALQGQITGLLNNLLEKINNDHPLTPAEISFLQKIHLPIYKILNVQSGSLKDSVVGAISNYAAVLATDILFKYLSENLNIVRGSSETLPYPSALMEKFSADIEKARADVQNQQDNAYKQMAVSEQLIQQSQNTEHALSESLSKQLQVIQ